MMAMQDPKSRAEAEVFALLRLKMGGHSVDIVRNGERLLGWSPGRRAGESVAIADIIEAARKN